MSGRKSKHGDFLSIATAGDGGSVALASPVGSPVQRRSSRFTDVVHHAFDRAVSLSDARAPRRPSTRQRPSVSSKQERRHTRLCSRAGSIASSDGNASVLGDSLSCMDACPDALFPSHAVTLDQSLDESVGHALQADTELRSRLRRCFFAVCSHGPMLTNGRFSEVQWRHLIRESGMQDGACLSLFFLTTAWNVNKDASDGCMSFSGFVVAMSVIGKRKFPSATDAEAAALNQLRDRRKYSPCEEVLLSALSEADIEVTTNAPNRSALFKRT
eukprot:gene8055-12384_t